MNTDDQFLFDGANQEILDHSVENALGDRNAVPLPEDCCKSSSPIEIAERNPMSPMGLTLPEACFLTSTKLHAPPVRTKVTVTRKITELATVILGGGPPTKTITSTVRRTTSIPGAVIPPPTTYPTVIVTVRTTTTTSITSTSTSTSTETSQTTTTSETRTLRVAVFEETTYPCDVGDYDRLAFPGRPNPNSRISLFRHYDNSALVGARSCCLRCYSLLGWACAYWATDKTGYACSIFKAESSAGGCLTN